MTKCSGHPRESGGDNLVDEIVRDKLPLSRNGLAHSFGGAGLHRLAQRVAGSDVSEAEALAQKLGLRAFAASGRTEEDESHEVFNPVARSYQRWVPPP